MQAASVLATANLQGKNGIKGRDFLFIKWYN
jgi:hypothetical protein